MPEPPTPGSAPAPSSACPLTERELQVLRLLDSELSGPQIARELFVSHNTVRTHTKHIFTKLDVTSRRAAVRPRPRTRPDLDRPRAAPDLTQSVTSLGDAWSPNPSLRSSHPAAHRHGHSEPGSRT